MGARLRLPVLGLLLGLASVPALAQSFLGSGPAERLTVPPSGNALRAPTGDGPDSARRPDAAGAEPRSTPRSPEPPRAAAPQTVPRGVIQSTIAPARRLPSGPRGFRLTGEEDSLRYPVYLTEAQTRGPARLRLSYLSAISVAPETSELAAFVNGTKVGWTRIQAPGAVKVVEFAVADGVLKPGYNAVTFTASQRHRVDCSIGATYELWTQIDPSRSGLVVGTATDMDVRSLAAAEPDESGALPIQVILNERPNLARLERMIEAVQAFALVGRAARPTVTFGPPLQGRNGINLVVGTASEIAGVEGVSELGPINGPRLAMLPTRPNAPPTLVVTGARDEDVRQAITNLAVPADTGTPSGLKAVQLFRGYMVHGGESLTLDRLGAASREFSGRLLHVGFDLRFPGDFVPADYGKVMLHLAGAYVAGLSSDARIVIDINGRNAASVPLPDGRGEVFDDSAIPLPFSLWRPGVNHVEISAQLPNAADQVCDTLSPAAKQARFLFLDRSRIEIPHFARAARSPDLAAIKGGAVPFVVPGQRPRLVLPTPDRDSADAAATLAARLAMASERVIDFEVVTQQQVASDTSQLVVAPARALDPALLESVGFDPQQVQRVWEGRADMVATPGQFGPEGVLTLDRLRRNLPMRCALPTLIPQVRPAQPAQAPSSQGEASAAPAPTSAPAPGSAPASGSSSDRELIDRWEASTRGSRQIWAAVDSVWNEITGTVRSLRQTVTAQVKPDETVEVPATASLLIAEGPPVQSSNTVIVTAPNASLLKASVSCLVDPVVWARLGGSAAFLDASNGTLVTSRPERIELVETQPRSLANLRLVSAAWLSINTEYYVGMTLAMALCLGLATTSLVRNVGRKNS
ncbi:cellulose biosynthesis cyclic di-GMP-binding regulatory protein BcsB [Methylobacterium sp. NMS12]|uniref:cellulose biosynthesis cyclic di-GMP-binding regulatory protein BcsB n=1 Tax=Methylobacterium sp. NMS12 TaxID=3079766 RepID=UPI003F884859